MARISAPRRRTFRIKAKWDPNVIGRRFKIYVFEAPPIAVDELEWELEVLLLLEEDVYPYLEAQGIPKELWEYYVAFAKRLWERRVHFDKETFKLEKTSLVNEFTLRGLDPTHLAAIQAFSELWAEKKLAGPKPPMYPGVSVLADTDDMASWPGATTTEGVPVGPGEWGGANVFGDNNSLIQWAGVTVVLGTVT